MQHYRENDRMLTIHEDKRISSWELVKKIDTKAARDVFDVALVKAPCYDAQGRQIPNVNHVQRVSGDESIILDVGAIGPTYTIMQHANMLDMVNSYILPELPGAEIETIGTLENGATGIVQISCGKDFHIDGDSSKQENRIYFNNPVGGGCVVMGFCLTRCICENTIAMARNEVLAGTRKGTGTALKHTSNLEVYAKIAMAEIAAQAKATKVMQERIKALAAKRVDSATIKKALAAIYPATPELADESPAAYTNTMNKRLEVINEWESGETAQSFTKDSAWKLVNAFTFPIFNPSKIAKSSDESGIKYDGIFGDRADKVAEILTTVEKIAA